MKKLKFNLKNLMLCAFLFSACAFLALPTRGQNSSNDKSATATVAVDQTVIDNCSKAFDELSVLDKLVESREAEIKLLKERLQLEQEKFDLMRQLADSRSAQAASLAEANNALKEALAVKEKVIENKDQEIQILKKKRTSILTIIKTVAVGISIGLILK